MVTRISDWYDLDDARNDLTADYELVNDLTPSTAGYDDVASSNANGGSGWNPIGDQSTTFSGSLDGAGHTVDGLYIGEPDRGNLDGTALLGRTRGAVIRNLTLVNIDVTAQTQAGGGLVGHLKQSSTVENCSGGGSVGGPSASYLGILVGDNDDSTIKNSDAAGTVSDAYRTGGIVGYSSGTVTGCESSVEVDGAITGGVAGDSTGTVIDSHATGPISGSSSVGGVVGKNQAGSTVENCYSTGSVSGTGDHLGGVTGRNAGTGAIVRDCYWSGDDTTAVSTGANANTGGVVGYCTESAEVTRCHAAGPVSSDSKAGGVVGRLRSGTVTDCYWESTNTVSTGNDAGGVIGDITVKAAVTVKRCYASGPVTGGSGTDIGGCIGRVANDDQANYEITSCCATGSVSGESDSQIGGLIGQLEANSDSSSLTECYWDTEATGQSNAVGDKRGGATLDATGRTTAQMQDTSALGYMGLLDYDVNWRPTSGYPELTWDSQYGSLGAAVDDLLAGDGTDSSPYLLESPGDLQAMNGKLDAVCELAGDIDASDTQSWHGGNGFEPVGDSDNPFSGTIDGNGYTIDGLYIDRASTDDVGLVGQLNGTISNLTLTSIDVTGNIGVGGIAGDNFTGTIKDCSADGTVSATDQKAGGIAGNARDSIVRCVSHCDVSTTNFSAGGLVGVASDVISACVATGTVTGADGAGDLGGLTGSDNGSTTTDSYALSAVEVTDGSRIGGLVGTIFNSNTTEISECYTAAAVTADSSSDVGGLIGKIVDQDGSSSVTNAYWDTETTGQSDGIGTQNGGIFDATGRTTSEMRGESAESNMSRLDFENTWTVLLNPDDYPALAWQYVRYAVSIANAPSEIKQGKTLTVDATVENIDSSTTTQTVRLTLAGNEQDTTDRTLDGGQSDPVTLDAEIVGYSPGTTTVAVEARTGRETVSIDILDRFDTDWTADTDGGMQASVPAVGTDRVYVGGLGSEMRAFDRASGSDVWALARAGSLSDSTPLLDESRDQLYVGSGGGTLYAITTSGSKVWTHDTDSAITSSPTLADGTVYVGSNDGTVRALDADTGSDDWSVQLDSPVYARPATDSQHVYVTAIDGTVHALSRADGSTVWTQSTGGSLVDAGPTAVSATGTVYVATDAVYALAAGDGSVDWQTSYGGTAGSTPVVDSRTLYAGDAAGTVHALDTDDSGSTLWTYDAGDAVPSTPAVLPSAVTVTSADGTVHSIDRDTGKMISTEGIAGSLRSSPVVVDGTLYVGTDDASGVVTLTDVPE